MTLGPIGTRRPPKKKMSLSLFLPVGLMDRIDVWRTQQFVVPSRNAAVRRILEEFLERVENK